MPPSVWSLLVKSAYNNPRLLQPERKPAAMNIYLQWRNVRWGKHLNKLNIQKSKGPDSIHLQVLRAWADQGQWETTLNCLWKVMMMGQSSWGLEESKGHIYLQEGGSRELQASQPHFSPWEGDGGKNLEAICKHLKDKKVIWSCQCGFMKVKSCLTNLIAFWDEINEVHLGGWGERSHWFFDFGKVLDTVKMNEDRLTERWIQIRLNCQA